MEQRPGLHILDLAAKLTKEGLKQLFLQIMLSDAVKDTRQIIQLFKLPSCLLYCCFSLFSLPAGY